MKCLRLSVFATCTFILSEFGMAIGQTETVRSFSAACHSARTPLIDMGQFPGKVFEIKTICFGDGGGHLGGTSLGDDFFIKPMVPAGKIPGCVDLTTGIGLAPGEKVECWGTNTQMLINGYLRKPLP